MGLHMVVYVLKMWKMQNFQNLHFEHMENVCYSFQVPPFKVVGMVGLCRLCRAIGG